MVTPRYLQSAVSHYRDVRGKVLARIEDFNKNSPLSAGQILFITVIFLLLFLGPYLLFQSYLRMQFKGVVCETLGIIGFVLYSKPRRTPRWFRSRYRSHRAYANVEGGAATKATRHLFFYAATIFLIFFPFSNFLHAIGLAPGLLLILISGSLWRGLTIEHSLHSIIAVVVLILFVWLWSEAGRPGLVVMPVDLPSGRTDMNFTGDGVANALETELEHFGLNESVGTYGDTEASKILARELKARLFPQSPWYKGSDARPPGLVGLQASHVVVGTDVEGFPLSNIYHILRHLRGMPLLEAQILLGKDDSLTLALRRSNSPLNCTTDLVSKELLSKNLLDRQTGQDAVEKLWKATEEQRTGMPSAPYNLGCSYGMVRFLLDWLDLVNLPSSGEERIANVTVHDLKGDAQLSAALHLATLQAMEHLSNERMALYYDNAGEYESAFSFYKKSIPDLLRETHESSPYTQEFPRQRLASALVRIGDFQGQIRNDCSASDRAYALADAVFPNDLHVLARIGYGYLLRAREVDWGIQTCGRASTSMSDSDRKALIKKTLIQGIGYLRRAVGAGKTDTATHRHGLKRRDETLAWASANLAYAVTLYSEGENEPYQVLSDVNVPNTDPDLRAAIVKEYVHAQSTPTFPDGSGCADSLKALREIDPAEGDPPSRPKYAAILSLHNNLLMEKQLEEIYTELSKKCPDQFKDRNYKVLEHKLLFSSLLALNYVQSGIQHPELPLLGLNKEVRAQLETQKHDAEAKVADTRNSHGQEDQGENRRADLPKKAPALGNLRSSQISLRLAFLTDSLERNETGVDICDPLSFDPNADMYQDSARAASLCAKLQSLDCRATSDQIQRAMQAVNAFPEDPFLRANLGIVQLQYHLKDALTTLQDAVRLNPREPRLRYLLSFALSANNRPEEARDQLDYGRALDPEGWRAAQYFGGKPLSPCPAAYVNSALSTDATKSDANHMGSEAKVDNRPVSDSGRQNRRFR